MGRVVIAGGSGYIGKALVKAFVGIGHEVVILSRSGRGVEGARTVRWDAMNPGDWYKEIDGALAVINLCGESLAQRWTPASMRRMRESRVGPTCLIGAAIANSEHPAQVWVNSSATGFYGDTGVREVSEATGKGKGFLADLCLAWESEVDKAETPKTRKVKLRTGLVLGPGSPLFDTLLRVTKLFAGGALGSGKQVMPWIHHDDLVRLFVWAVQSDVTGAVNGTAPKPATNAALMAALRESVGRPAVPNLPEFAVKTVAGAMGWDPSFLLGSCRAVPEIALGHGFKFEHTDVQAAVDDLTRSVPEAWRQDEAA